MKQILLILLATVFSSNLRAQEGKRIRCAGAKMFYEENGSLESMEVFNIFYFYAEGGFIEHAYAIGNEPYDYATYNITSVIVKSDLDKENYVFMTNTNGQEEPITLHLDNIGGCEVTCQEFIFPGIYERENDY